jgi:DNA-binding transcriptional ArsR family regulator
VSAARARSAARRTAPVFAALGDETRLTLVERLAGTGSLSIARLTEGTDVTRQAVTKHLLVLKSAGLVRSAREGRERVWELAPAPLIEAGSYLRDVSTRWDEALARLRAFVEES